MENVSTDAQGIRSELVFTLELRVQFIKPIATFYLTLVCEELTEEGTIVDSQAVLLEALDKWWRYDNSRMTSTEATMLLWKKVTDYLMDTKQFSRVQCSEVRVEPIDGVVTKFVPSEDNEAEV
jgi:hypothetical protein